MIRNLNICARWRLGIRLAGFAMLAAGLTARGFAAPALDVYGKLPGIELVKLSPSGERLAMIGVIGESRRLLIFSTGGTLLQTGAVGDAKVRDLDWAGEGHVLVTTTATVNLKLDFDEYLELANVIQVNLTKHDASIIFEHTPEIAQTVRGFYGSAQKDGKSYGYFGGITLERQGTQYFFAHGYADLYRVDLDTRQVSLEAKGAERQRQWVVSADGRVIAHSDYNTDNGEWRLFSAMELHDALIKRSDPTAEIGLLGAGRTAGTVLIVDRNGSSDRLEEINLSTGAAESLLDEHRVTEYWFDPVTRLFVGAETLESPGAVFFDRGLQARSDATRKAFPGLQVHLDSFSHDMKNLVVTTDGGQDSGTVWLVDIASGDAKPLGHQYPGVGPEDVGPQQLFKFQAADGLDLEGVLTLPPGRDAKNLPVIVMPHGGPIGARDQLGFDWWAQALASRGYAVFQPNFRGSSGYGSAFRDAGYGQWGRKMLSDISDGLASLANRGLVDPKRACIVGASYGGYAALAGVTLQQGLYRCAVSVSGPANLQTFGNWLVTRNGRRSDTARYWNKVTGADVDGGQGLRAISPALLADQADAPILLIHGRDDTRVPIEQSEEMRAALKHANKTVDFVELPHEDHFLSREYTRIAMLEATVRFVEQYNPAR